MIWNILDWIEEIVGGILFCATIFGIIYYGPYIMLYYANR